MDAAICTLFEGDYHHGVGALVNSLCKHGYRGVVWVGCRGALPPWAQPLARKDGYDEFQLSSGGVIRFVPLDTDVHLTNYKPDFMLRIWEQEDPDVAKLFYFDPDIVIKCEWEFFEEWVEGGVALCEDINSPMPGSHPIRNAWRRFYGQKGIELTGAPDAYVNAGFIGVMREHWELLETWKRMLVALRDETGSLNQLGFGNRPYAFYNADQDVLNAALMACDIRVSLVGKDGMDFIPGGYIMSHAVGKAKPWRKQMLRSALGGYPPTLADKGYWQNVEAPIRVWPAAALLLRKLDLTIGSALGRLMRRA
jgi:hypothetical protein